eukprot:TRINITY_DN6298_c0_g1_i1.p1 TRINITY_DN6298_c0_g1~~TRINITY_DN6298_c0_g1_i1.p1  ORF type:complete len:281 (-),score=37.27 TRINITY_DN6298_c0_g1_i1:72-914(-)
MLKKKRSAGCVLLIPKDPIYEYVYEENSTKANRENMVYLLLTTKYNLRNDFFVGGDAEDEDKGDSKITLSREIKQELGLDINQAKVIRAYVKTITQTSFFYVVFNEIEDDLLKIQPNKEVLGTCLVPICYEKELDENFGKASDIRNIWTLCDSKDDVEQVITVLNYLMKEAALPEDLYQKACSSLFSTSKNFANYRGSRDYKPIKQLKLFEDCEFEIEMPEVKVGMDDNQKTVETSKETVETRKKKVDTRNKTVEIKKTCRYYKEGRCSYGTKCKNSHQL